MGKCEDEGISNLTQGFNTNDEQLKKGFRGVLALALVFFFFLPLNLTDWGIKEQFSWLSAKPSVVQREQNSSPNTP